MNPEYFLNFANIDEMIQLFRTVAPYDTSFFEDFIYLKSDLANVKSVERLWSQQMSIAMEVSRNNIDYMQKSVNLMQQSMLGFMENVYTHHPTNAETVNKYHNE